MVDGFLDFEPIRAPDHFVERAETQLRHQLANFLGDEAHETHDVGGIAGKFFPQFRVLRGDADGASVQMANAHHDAAHRHERRSGKTKFFGAQQRSDDDVTARFQLAVSLDRDAAAQIVQH